MIIQRVPVRLTILGVALALLLGINCSFAKSEAKNDSSAPVSNVQVAEGVSLTVGGPKESRERCDSLHWSPATSKGWELFNAAKQSFPRASSLSLENYLVALSDAFSRTLPSVPKLRSHFYVADTLNASLWPLGGGFFVVHAGLIRQLRDERQFAFLIALELAHEALGHNQWQFSLSETSFDSWSVEFWTRLVARDPIGRAYAMEQEASALGLVYRFFKANAWEYEGINRLVADGLSVLNEIPGASSLATLHQNLSDGIKLQQKNQVPDQAFVSSDAVINRLTYEKALEEIQTSPLQKHPWMLELMPYQSFLREKTASLNKVRESYNEFSDRFSSKIDQVLRKPRGKTLDEEIFEFEAINKTLTSRAKFPMTILARAYLKNTILLAHRRWGEAEKNSRAALAFNPSAEPLLLQYAKSLEQLGQFTKLEKEFQNPWKIYDHRRELLLAQAAFLDGRYTDAAALARAYRKKYPYDIEGAFWNILSELRVRRATAPLMDKVEAFWGDRPMTRALKIFYYGYLEKPTEAARAMDFKSDQSYSLQEWGVFEFAQAWLRESLAAGADDLRAAQLHGLSELHWPLSRLVRRNLPRPLGSR